MYNSTKPYTKQIISLIQQTWATPYVEIRDNTYVVISKKFSCFEVDHTDGIGTKGVYHWQKRSFKNAVLDALAMNLNDLALVRAVPYKLQNHILIPKDDHRAILAIVKALSQECTKRQVAITGGETSVHDNMNGLDISLSVSGLIKNLKPNKFQVGDALIGLKSDGLHSNGFTKVREIFGKEYRSDFIRPTAIYLDTILALDKKFDIHGMMHITGGAFTKLKGLLDGTDARINRNYQLEPQPIFKELYQHGVSDMEMYRTFNCGIGFVLSVMPQAANAIISQSSSAAIIGEVVGGHGRVVIESMFSQRVVEF